MAGDAPDDADRQSSSLKHRALLDMHLAVAEQLAAQAILRDARRVPAKRADRVGHGDPGRVDQVKVASVKYAGHGAAAEVCRSEAKALLVGET